MVILIVMLLIMKPIKLMKHKINLTEIYKYYLTYI